MDRDELGGPFAVADNSLRQLQGNVVQRLLKTVTGIAAALECPAA